MTAGRTYAFGQPFEFAYEVIPERVALVCISKRKRNFLETLRTLRVTLRRLNVAPLAELQISKGRINLSALRGRLSTPKHQKDEKTKEGPKKN